MKLWYVDLPNPQKKEEICEDDTFVPAGVYTRYEDALKFLDDVFGMPKEVADFFITEGWRN